MASVYRTEDCQYTVDREALVQRLAEALQGDSLLVDDEAMRPYECDGLAGYRQMPQVVTIPETIEQVRHVLRVCHDMNLPVVARGAGTSLSAGALPHPQGVLLSLARFNKILEIDHERRMARLQPGVRNLAISEAAAPYGLYYAPDPSSQITCSIGGNVAENAGGVHCLKYGLTVHNILEVTMITMAGEEVTLGSEALDSAGYDLLAAVTGSEGMLGVIVEIKVKLLPQPPAKDVLLASFADVETAGNAVAGIIGAGIVPGGLEMMDKLAIQAAEDFVQAGYPTDAAAILICELDGSPDDVRAQRERVCQLLDEYGAAEIRVAGDEDEKARFWAGRKAAFPAVGRISPDYYCIDGTIPRKHLAYVLQRMQELSDEYGLRVANVFHAGDGNLHPLVLYDGNVPGEFERTEELGGRILELCVEVGGTVTGEHGVGMEKINQMCVQFGSPDLEQFRALKYAFDPSGLLNPGKAIPTLNRCAEFGAMHVHHGELPHPDIPRY
ncbi:FAD-linked oxidase C-terminal domain-containing protein [Aquisalimonas lutea]|uniref:FAD-linked oxidase C-terminal domain-containing protein n=1 Tax=Aquisalimonas lutea TaxID=1327750 RepID=UPI0025B5A2AF|nr:FAD-linked oxidase C-terminal domain-containing protein [Aquisalimonas lutea]MDN3518339.1 FAD-linked oxidase C-terminal domain-containing protein [Aquisalimonas lutea]